MLKHAGGQQASSIFLPVVNPETVPMVSTTRCSLIAAFVQRESSDSAELSPRKVSGKKKILPDNSIFAFVARGESPIGDSNPT